MKTLKIFLERSDDMFSAYAENAKGIYGGGDTVEEAKQFILDAITIITGVNQRKLQHYSPGWEEAPQA